MSDAAFPTQGILPRQETQAEAFVQANPEFDGRGTVVAILDTGVDPGAIGLQTTSDGRPKVIDVIDCGGSGDVDTTTTVTGAETDGVREIKGLSGRALRLNAAWENPGGAWRVGLKRAFELYPRGLTAYVKGERRKRFDAAQRAAEAALRRELAEWKAAHAAPAASAADKEALQDLEDRLAHLQQAAKDYDDPGPILDCVVWKDSEGWAAVAELMRPYHVARQYGRLSDVDQLNYAINVYDEGATLSIVCDAGAHGTHVAGIVAAHHPDQPELDGVAPGAQIISLKISDTRLGSMETGVGLVRALREAVRLKVDAINMSFGEATSIPNRGRFIALAEEVVNKHGIIFLASAGNNGPAISTVGSPGGTSTAIMGIGAYVSPIMMEASYSMRDVPKGGCNFTWSSVGPAADGSWGVSIMAPGGAIAPVPNWTLQKSQLMNGTSMSSPNACGCIALLLSACKAQGLPRTPQRVRRAVENTAAPLAGLERLVQGHGMIQVQAAWEHLQAHAARDTEDVRYVVTVNGAARGVHLRQPLEVARASQHTVTVAPTFHEDAPAADKINFELQLRLASDALWVLAPGVLVLMHKGRSFNIEVDPTGLPPGVHFATVVATDTRAGAAAAGPLFEVPITVVKPLTPSAQLLKLGALPLRAGGAIARAFVAPPEGTLWMDITVRDGRVPGGEEEGEVTAGEQEGGEGPEGGGAQGGGGGAAHKMLKMLMVLHAVQLLPHRPYRDTERHKYLQLLPGQTEVLSMRVMGSSTVELTLAQYWSTQGSTSLDVSVEFRGATPHTRLAMHTGCGHALVTVSAKVRMEEVQPAAVLDTWVTKLLPTSAAIAPLGERDVLTDARQIYQLILEYNFNQSAKGDVVPRLPGLNEYLYESALEAQMVMIFDANKRLVGVTDAWPAAVKCKEGDYVARVSIRSDDPALLKRLQGKPLLLERSIKGAGSEVSITAYASAYDMMVGGRAMGATRVLQGTSVAVVWAEPPTDKLPKGVKPGDVLLGTATYVKSDKPLPGDRPGQVAVSYAVGPVAPAEKDKDKDKPMPEDTRTEDTAAHMTTTRLTTDALLPCASIAARQEEKVESDVRDLWVSKVLALVGKTSFDDLYKRACALYEGHLPLLQARLAHVDADAKRAEQLGAVAEAADAIIAKASGQLRLHVDQAELAQHYGTRLPTDDPAANKLSADMSKRRDALREALAAKARALADAALAASPNAAAAAAAPPASAAAAAAADDGEAAAAAAAADTAAAADASDEPAAAAPEAAAPAAAEATGSAAAAAAAAAPAAVAAPSPADAAADAAYAELRKWDDVAQDKYAAVALAHHARARRRGSMLKVLNRVAGAAASAKAPPGLARDAALTRRAALYGELGWAHLAAADAAWAVLSKPAKYAPF
ncbi:subtilase family-domain-containing protein [Tribonema minus]|uniref:Tripeptidyl-peptidase 2 n=1 Tax=Tribonema minus TaxID=303371 RepID=A0A836CLL6_9STRA|nr:subtilase family-domain-containing protein [Tribonema minus]